jgi:hypothetical protein
VCQERESGIRDPDLKREVTGLYVEKKLYHGAPMIQLITLL